MMPRLVFTDSYEKCAKKFLKKHPHLKPRYIKILKLLKIDPFHPVLKLHKLSGDLKNLYSLSLDYSYRIIIHFLIKDDVIVPIDIGSHDQVY